MLHFSSHADWFRSMPITKIKAFPLFLLRSVDIFALALVLALVIHGDLAPSLLILLAPAFAFIIFSLLQIGGIEFVTIMTSRICCIFDPPSIVALLSIMNIRRMT